ncbi:MAG: hypothetical protein AAF628_17965 [Planctomycetota bacterium]
MAKCEECGSAHLSELEPGPALVLECELCGALTGNDLAVGRALLRREAVERGVDPDLYPLVRLLDTLPGLRVVTSHGGDPQARVWPMVQLAPTTPDAWRSIENLVKSLTLSAARHDVHWVVEVEVQTRLVLTLKPRFHRGTAEITAAQVSQAQRDLQRVQQNLERDTGLSWWGRA